MTTVKVGDRVWIKRNNIGYVYFLGEVIDKFYVKKGQSFRVMDISTIGSPPLEYISVYIPIECYKSSILGNFFDNLFVFLGLMPPIQPKKLEHFSSSMVSTEPIEFSYFQKLKHKLKGKVK
jgi:hypothetical protein